MATDPLSPDARALLSALLGLNDWGTIAPGLEVVQLNIEDGDNGRTIAAIRELAGTSVDIASRPAAPDEARAVGAPLDGSVVVTSAAVLHLESELVPVDAPDEPVSVWVSLGRSVPREALWELAKGRSEP